MKQREASQHDIAAQWNANVSIGDTVVYRSYPGSEPELFLTRTAAIILSGHTAVVRLNGKSGCVAVDACRKVDER